MQASVDVSVRNVMDREYVGVSEADPLVETVELMLAERAESVVVLRGNEAVGVMTERDVLSLLVSGTDPSSAAVSDAMRWEVPSVSPDCSLEEAADIMSAQDIRRLLVTDDGDPLGVMTEHDLLTASATHDRPGDATPAMAADHDRRDRGTDDRYATQSVCETCGTLTPELADRNGQLVCPNCREI